MVSEMEHGNRAFVRFDRYGPEGLVERLRQAEWFDNIVDGNHLFEAISFGAFCVQREPAILTVMCKIGVYGPGGWQDRFYVEGYIFSMVPLANTSERIQVVFQNEVKVVGTLLSEEPTATNTEKYTIRLMELLWEDRHPRFVPLAAQVRGH